MTADGAILAARRHHLLSSLYRSVRPHRPASAIHCVAAAVLVGLLGALGVTDLPLETATVLVPIPLDASFKLSFILEKIVTTSNFK